MDHDVALGTVDVVLQMLHDAALAEGVETLGDGGGVHQVAGADLAGDHLVDRANVYLSLSCRDGRYGCSRVDHFHFCLFQFVKESRKYLTVSVCE